jgi:ectoine hydroxylase-related dioxygenase (phytanoyl-CoA dioxygenase family)
MNNSTVARYGVHKQTRSETEIDRAVESIRLIGWAIVDGGYGPAEIARFATSFDRALETNLARHGAETLRRLDENNTIRALLGIDRTFLELALNPTVLAICRRLMGEYIILHQQNGIINPPNAQHYNQAAFHRDLPYQHFVSSHPLAVNALYCVDTFTEQNGGTYVLPASHKSEAFPSDAMVNVLQRQISAKAGSFIFIDSMLFHCGGVNHTERPRRAVSHLYSLPILRPQIELSVELGDDYVNDTAVRRLLGYDVRTPQSVAAFYAARQGKVRGR